MRVDSAGAVGAVFGDAGAGVGVGVGVGVGAVGELAGPAAGAVVPDPAGADDFGGAEAGVDLCGVVEAGASVLVTGAVGAVGAAEAA